LESGTLQQKGLANACRPLNLLSSALLWPGESQKLCTPPLSLGSFFLPLAFFLRIVISDKLNSNFRFALSTQFPHSDLLFVSALVLITPMKGAGKWLLI
jgi:hypothetical protein